MTAAPTTIEEQIAQLDVDAPVGPLCPPRKHAYEVAERLADLVPISGDAQAAVVQVLAEELALAREDMRQELLRRMQVLIENPPSISQLLSQRTAQPGPGLPTRVWQRMLGRHAAQDGPGSPERRSESDGSE